jgi:hypothetical protein
MTANDRVNREEDGTEEGTPRPIPRKIVSADSLLQHLNQRLDGYGHCQSCHFAGPIRLLDATTDDGRNWSNFVPLVCSDEVGSGCIRIAERILADAAREYNLLVPA